MPWWSGLVLLPQEEVEPPDVAVCGDSWLYTVPSVTNGGSGPGEGVFTIEDFTQPQPPGDFDLLRWELPHIVAAECDEYTGTFVISQIPDYIHTALLDWIEATITGPDVSPYSATAQWGLQFYSATVDISTTCIYYWPGVIAPDIAFLTQWNLGWSGGAMTPDFSPASGFVSGLVHPIAGTYSFTGDSGFGAEGAAFVTYQSTAGIGVVNDVIGPISLDS